jgi:serine/threonine-protein kinase
MPLPLSSGDVLRGRYKIRKRIGEGGTGNIYLADDLRLEGRLCALKEVEHDKTLPKRILEEARQQFFREATTLARLDHPNLPKVSDFFSTGARDYLVMDYVPGKDLRTMVLEARRYKRFLGEETVLGWARQLLDALIYLHHQEPPIVHRDIKPSNLKLTPDGLLKLVDFGLVKVMLPDEMTITVIQGQGTVLYTPLEQYGGDGSHTDVRSDIYAFGATIYHLLTNEPPVDARQRFLNPESLIPPRQINPSIHPRTEEIILWAMALHPDKRPESVDVLHEALFGSRERITRPRAMSPWEEESLSQMLSRAPESVLFWTTMGVALFSLIVTLSR